MHQEQKRQDGQQPEGEAKKRVIESASATTSPDNANSGKFAYIITAVALGVTLVLGLFVSGCTSLVLAVSAQNYTGGGHGSAYGRNLDTYEFDEELQDFIDKHYPIDNEAPEGDYSDGSSQVSLDEALDYDLAPYQKCIGDLVYASSYSGAKAEVRDFVRQVVNADEDYSSRLVLLLNDAALNEQTRTQKLGEALALCTEAQQGLDALAIPDVPDDQSGEVKDALGTAKSEAVGRWQKMYAEIELLNSGSISSNALWNLDDDVLEATEDAAYDLEQALSASANL